MRDRPPLDDAAIADALMNDYGIRVVKLAHLPLGYDADARVFRVECGDSRFFLKARSEPPNAAAMRAPRHLQTCGIRAAVAPIETACGELTALCDGFFLILYPWIAGDSAMGRSLSRDQWRQWGEIMRAIHSVAIEAPLILKLPRETFGTMWVKRFDAVSQAVTCDSDTGNFARLTAATWREHAAGIEDIGAIYIELGARFQARSPGFVLCHADIHKDNLLLDAAGELHIVDWDGVVLAPKERDLMFFIDDGHEADEAAAFFDGYGGSDYDHVGLAYYKFDWVMQELCDFGERLLLPSSASDAQLAYDYAEFQRLFAPGDVIERAYRALEAIDA